MYQLQDGYLNQRCYRIAHSSHVAAGVGGDPNGKTNSTYINHAERPRTVDKSVHVTCDWHCVRRSSCMIGAESGNRSRPCPMALNCIWPVNSSFHLYKPVDKTSSQIRSSYSCRRMATDQIDLMQCNVQWVVDHTWRQCSKWYHSRLTTEPPLQKKPPPDDRRIL